MRSVVELDPVGAGLNGVSLNTRHSAVGRVVLVAGEASGDLLGAGLIDALRRRRPDLVFEGVAGPRMEEAGCRAWFPMERLAVMGLVEVLGRLPALLALRRELIARLRRAPPDVLIGIDAPDFNLGLERRVRALGIPTVHYVGPTVWAWRRGRLRGIRRAVDRMLTLFPFEEAVYREHGIPVTCVGHPLADEIPPEDQRAGARARLGLAPDMEAVALLPGSRIDEVRRLAGVFLEAARWCLARRPGLRILAAMAGPRVREVFEGIRSDCCADLPVEVIEGRSRDVLAAADVVLAASGTATLEAMLLRRPMVVAYRLHPLTYPLVRALVRIPRVALPNVLSGEDLVPEFLQREVTPERLGGAVLHWLAHPAEVERLTARFAALHHELRRGASERAAEAVLESARRPGGAS